MRDVAHSAASPDQAPYAVAEAVFADAKAYLSSREAQQMSESELERELHRRGQELMRRLLQGHLDQRTPGDPSWPMRDLRRDGTAQWPRRPRRCGRVSRLAISVRTPAILDREPRVEGAESRLHWGGGDGASANSARPHERSFGRSTGLGTEC